jgi:hypothetical protein
VGFWYQCHAVPRNITHSQLCTLTRSLFVYIQADTDTDTDIDADADTDADTGT